MIDARSDSYIHNNLMSRAGLNLPYYRKNRPFKVLVCAITLVAFLFNIVSYDIAWAAGTPSELTSVGPDRAVSPGTLKELNPATFTLPQYLGTIKDSWSPSVIARSAEGATKQSQTLSTIIHIQDAHCNYYAQHRIAEIIEYLNKVYGVNTVNLEGGAKDYDISIFTDIKDKNVREKAADYFVKEGVVNGAEYFAINNPEKVNLWGIEDVRLYIDNLKTYRNSLKYKDEVDKYLKNLSYILSNLKVKIYSKELLELDSRYNAYKINNADFKDYLSYLTRKAKERLIDIKSYTNIYLLSQTLGQEGDINFRKANNERDELIDKLGKRLSKNALEELVLKTVEFKSERISQADFYQYLANKAKSINLKLDDFPELKKYSVYVATYQATDKAKIMNEVTNLENKLKASLFTNDKDRELDVLSKNLALMKNMFNISLTREDYNYYQSNKASFNTRNYSKFIECEAPLYKIQAKLDDNIAKLDDYREEICKFYEYSFKRDTAFMKNIRDCPPSRGNPKVGTVPNLSILITGGFHTENLCDIFKKQGISYVSIIPNFKNSDGYACPYFKILSGEKNLRIIDALPSVLNRALATASPFCPAYRSTELEPSGLRSSPTEAIEPVTPVLSAAVAPAAGVTPKGPSTETYMSESAAEVMKRLRTELLSENASVSLTRFERKMRERGEFAGTDFERRVTNKIGDRYVRGKDYHIGIIYFSQGLHAGNLLSILAGIAIIPWFAVIPFMRIINNNKYLVNTSSRTSFLLPMLFFVSTLAALPINPFTLILLANLSIGICLNLINAYFIEDFTLRHELKHIYTYLLLEELRKHNIIDIKPEELDRLLGHDQGFGIFSKEKINDAELEKLEQRILNKVVIHVIKMHMKEIATSPPAPSAATGLCVTADTLLTLQDGRQIPIIEIGPGDYVMSLNEPAQKIEPHRVMGLLDMGIKPVYKLTTASGRSIKTTANHPYFTQTGWVKVSGLKVGGEIAVPKSSSQKIFEFFNGDIRAFEDSAQGAGFDTLGTVQGHNDTPGEIAGMDENNVASSLTPHDKFSLFQGPYNTLAGNLRQVGRIQADTSISSRKTSESGTGRPSSLSDWMYKAAASLAFATVSSRVSPWVVHPKRAGIYAENPPEGSFSTINLNLYIKHLLNLHIYSPLLNLLYHTSVEMSRLAPYPAASAGLVWAEEAPAGDILWDMIVSIEPLGREHVYDIEVEGTHNFIGNNIFAHNTAIPPASPLSAAVAPAVAQEKAAERAGKTLITRIAAIAQKWLGGNSLLTRLLYTYSVRTESPEDVELAEGKPEWIVFNIFERITGRSAGKLSLMITRDGNNIVVEPISDIKADYKGIGLGTWLYGEMRKQLAAKFPGDYKMEGRISNPETRMAVANAIAAKIQNAYYVERANIDKHLVDVADEYIRNTENRTVEAKLNEVRSFLAYFRETKPEYKDLFTPDNRELVNLLNPSKPDSKATMVRMYEVRGVDMTTLKIVWRDNGDFAFSGQVRGTIAAPTAVKPAQGQGTGSWFPDNEEWTRNAWLRETGLSLFAGGIAWVLLILVGLQDYAAYVVPVVSTLTFQLPHRTRVFNPTVLFLTAATLGAVFLVITNPILGVIAIVGLTITHRHINLDNLSQPTAPSAAESNYILSKITRFFSDLNGGFSREQSLIARQETERIIKWWFRDKSEIEQQEIVNDISNRISGWGWKEYFQYIYDLITRKSLVDKVYGIERLLLASAALSLVFVSMVIIFDNRLTWMGRLIAIVVAYLVTSVMKPLLISIEGHGRYNNKQKKIFINPGLENNFLPGVVAHEIIHLLAAEYGNPNDIPFASVVGLLRAVTVDNEGKVLVPEEYKETFEKGRKLAREHIGIARFQKAVEFIHDKYGDKSMGEVWKAVQLRYSYAGNKEKAWTYRLGGVVAGIIYEIGLQHGSADVSWEYLRRLMDGEDPDGIERTLAPVALAPSAAAQTKVPNLVGVVSKLAEEAKKGYRVGPGDDRNKHIEGINAAVNQLFKNIEDDTKEMLRWNEADIAIFENQLEEFLKYLPYYLNNSEAEFNLLYCVEYYHGTIRRVIESRMRANAVFKLTAETDAIAYAEPIRIAMANRTDTILAGLNSDRNEKRKRDAKEYFKMLLHVIKLGRNAGSLLDPKIYEKAKTDIESIINADPRYDTGFGAICWGSDLGVAIAKDFLLAANTDNRSVDGACKWVSREIGLKIAFSFIVLNQDSDMDKIYDDEDTKIHETGHRRFASALSYSKAFTAKEQMGLLLLDETCSYALDKMQAGLSNTDINPDELIGIFKKHKEGISSDLAKQLINDYLVPLPSEDADSNAIYSAQMLKEVERTARIIFDIAIYLLNNKQVKRDDILGIISDIVSEVGIYHKGIEDFNKRFDDAKDVKTFIESLMNKARERKNRVANLKQRAMESFGTAEPSAVAAKPAREGKAKPLTDGSITYGWFDPAEEAVVIDREKAKEMLKSSGLKDAQNLPDHKLTAFVHCHEVFHELVKNLEMVLEDKEEEDLANAFAGFVLSERAPPQGIEKEPKLQSFLQKITDQEAHDKILALFMAPYRVNDKYKDTGAFLLALHRLGININNVRLMEKDETMPEGAKAMAAPSAAAAKPANTVEFDMGGTATIGTAEGEWQFNPGDKNIIRQNGPNLEARLITTGPNAGKFSIFAGEISDEGLNMDRMKLFNTRSRAFKLLLAALLHSLGSKNTVREILGSSGNVMANPGLLNMIYSKTNIKNEAQLVAAVNQYAISNKNIAQHMQEVNAIAQTKFGKGYDETIQEIAAVLAMKASKDTKPKIGVTVLKQYIEELQRDAVRDEQAIRPYHQTLKLVGAVIDPRLANLTQAGLLKEAQIEQIMNRLNEFSPQNLDDVIRAANETANNDSEYRRARGLNYIQVNYNPIRDAIYGLRPTQAPPTIQTSASKPELSKGKFSEILNTVPTNKPLNICFVCTANFNRSPAMEIMAKHLTHQAGAKNVNFSSFGVLVGDELRQYNGMTNTELVEAAKELGVSAENRQVAAKAPTVERIEGSDIIIVASEEHRQKLIREALQRTGKDISNKVMIFGELLTEMLQPDIISLQQEIQKSGIRIDLNKLMTSMPDPQGREISNKDLLILIGKVMDKAFIPKIMEREDVSKGAAAKPEGEGETPAQAAIMTGVLISNERTGDYIIGKIENLAGLDDTLEVRQRSLEIMLRSGHAYKDKGSGIVFIKIHGLLENTGQFAHIGLGQAYGQTVVYIDEDYTGNPIVEGHELAEIALWRGKFGTDMSNVRDWMRQNQVTAVDLTKEFHERANQEHNIDDLAEKLGVVPYEYSVEELLPGESPSIAAAGDVFLGYRNLINISNRVSLMEIEELKKVQERLKLEKSKLGNRLAEMHPAARGLIEDLELAISKAIEENKIAEKVVLVEPQKPKKTLTRIDGLKAEISELSSKIERLKKQIEGMDKEDVLTGQQEEALQVIKEERWEKQRELIEVLYDALEPAAKRNERIDALRNDARSLVNKMVVTGRIGNREEQGRIDAAALQIDKMIGELRAEYMNFAAVPSVTSGETRLAAKAAESAGRRYDLLRNSEDITELARILAERNWYFHGMETAKIEDIIKKRLAILSPNFLRTIKEKALAELRGDADIMADLSKRGHELSEEDIVVVAGFGSFWYDENPSDIDMAVIVKIPGVRKVVRNILVEQNELFTSPLNSGFEIDRMDLYIASEQYYDKGYVESRSVTAEDRYTQFRDEAIFRQDGIIIEGEDYWSNEPSRSASIATIEYLLDVAKTLNGAHPTDPTVINMGPEKRAHKALLRWQMAKSMLERLLKNGQFDKFGLTLDWLMEVDKKMKIRMSGAPQSDGVTRLLTEVMRKLPVLKGAAHEGKPIAEIPLVPVPSEHNIQAKRINPSEVTDELLDNLIDIEKRVYPTAALQDNAEILKASLLSPGINIVLRNDSGQIIGYFLSRPSIGVEKAPEQKESSLYVTNLTVLPGHESALIVLLKALQPILRGGLYTEMTCYARQNVREGQKMSMSEFLRREPIKAEIIGVKRDHRESGETFDILRIEVANLLRPSERTPSLLAKGEEAMPAAPAMTSEQEITARTKAITEGYNNANRDAIVRTIVGVPAAIIENIVPTTISSINSKVGDAHFGEREGHDRQALQVDRDKRQFVKYDIHDKFDDTIDGLDRIIDKELKNSSLQDGRLVVFILQPEQLKENEEAVLPDKLKKYEKEPNVTFIFDYYTDRYAKTEGKAKEEKPKPVCPDFMLRGAIARQVDRYYRATTDGERAVAREEINRLRRDASPKNAPIATIDDLKRMPLIAKSLCENVEQWMKMEEATAKSV